MEKQKQSNITINWKGKSDKRGLTEFTMETMRKMLGRHEKFPDINTKLEEIRVAYEELKADKFFSIEKEIKMLSKFVRVLI